MFVTAIEKAARFTRAIHTLARAWGSNRVMPGAATLFFVNSDGWALTCSHVAKNLIAADQLAKRYALFKSEGGGNSPDQKHGYTSGSIIELKNRFMDCVEGGLNLQVRLHPSADVALLQFTGYARLLCSEFPIFAKDGSELKQGKSICRLGFPFPEFTNFEYDEHADEMRWTATGRGRTPQFPIEGMVTRHLVGQDGQTTIGFEVSTPGLKGQSGGPAFGSDGRIWGMQSATNHLDLDFDVDIEVFRAGQKRRVQESAVLHVGHCVHVDVLKEFMRSHHVRFSEA